MPAPILKLERVSKTYPAIGDGKETAVLRDIWLSAQPGESMAVVGPSGSGKSTLLHILGGLDTADSGVVEVDGRDLRALDTQQLARFRSQSVGFVFQEHYLLPQCTTLENVLIPVLAQSRAADASKVDRARQLLERVGLSGRLDHPAARLSGGERQRAALARALINGPALLLADEPTGSLDLATARSITQLLRELTAEHHTAVVVATHSTELAQAMGRVLRLANGVLESAQ